MNSQDSRAENTSPSSEDPRADSETVTRAEEQGEADESDGPTNAEENEGMSTILDSSPLSGVQDNASEE